MSNVVPFPKGALTGELKRKQQTEQAERIRKLGGQAINNLASWRRNIPIADRERLARNMDAIIDAYHIEPSKLDWMQDYLTVEDFRRDIHRMRLPESAAPGRRLIATPVKWTRLLGYISQYIQVHGESASLEFLADRLIRGTRFHPTKKEQSHSEKLLYLLDLWANELSEKFGLLSTYRRIARARAEYYAIHRCDIHARDQQPELDPASHKSKLSDDFSIASEEYIELFDKEFRHYTTDDWKALYKLIPDDWHSRYQMIQGEITDWKNTYSQEGTLHSYEMRLPVLWWGEDIPFLPHWFVGYLGDSDANVVTETSEHWLAEIIKKQGTVDPILLGQKIDWDLCAGYLVLYPDTGLNRVIPYLYYLSAEGSDFEPINQSYDLEHCEFYQPRGVNETTVSHTLLTRIEESREELYHSWAVTSRQLESHPYLVWKKNRETAIEREIRSVLTRTGRIKPRNNRK